MVRFRAIFLTSLSTIGGLTPLIMETDFQAKFLIPMALSIAAGIAFATVLTLVLVPSLIALLSDARLLVHRLRYGYWPKRVDVEPARNRHLDPLADKPALETRPMITQRSSASNRRVDEKHKLVARRSDAGYRMPDNDRRLCF